MAGKTCYCQKCNKTMDEGQFYGSNNLEKYPEGKLHMCKKCISMHIDNWDPDTYLWILQECDVPYVPKEWHDLMATYCKDRSKVTGLTILGRYLSKMRLKQYRDYRWKDTEFIQQLNNAKIEQTMKRQGYSAQQIADAVNKATFDISEANTEEPEYNDIPIQDLSHLATGQEDYFAEVQDLPDEQLDLTDDEKLMLRLKWGKTYKPEEWVQLEKLYKEMMQSYDIQTAAHIDTLKLICKTSLKCNQLIDMGDIDAYQKMSKVYDTLMKSGKFTAAQNKAETGEFVDSIGELVAICEKEGFIPRYYIGEPNDKVDETIRDMQRYTKTLITEETNLSQLLEDAIKTIQKEDEAEAEANDDDDETEDDVEEVERELREEDYEEFDNYLEEQGEIDNELLAEFLEEDDS